MFSRTARLIALGAVVLMALSFRVSVAWSREGQSFSFIRDAEIEHYLRELAAPIYRAAGIDSDAVSIYIINSNVVNAFVAEGMNEFFFTGLLQLTETPEQLAGVIAHETGHIAGGHLIRGREAMANASAEAILGMLVGVAAGVASGKGDLAVGAISGSQQIAERNFLSFSRAQEASADAAAISYLDRSGLTSEGLEQFMEKLGAQDILPIDRQVEYVRTHPLSQNRVEAIRQHVATSNVRGKLDPKFVSMHERMKAKLTGYLQPETALLRYTDKDPRLTARYARAIALYRTGHLDRALGIADSLIQAEPDNPFFIELKAQMLFENARVDQAVALYKRAVEMLPGSALLRLEYGHALLESKDAKAYDKAIPHLLEAQRMEPHDPETWRLLAVAWGRKGESLNDPLFTGYASYALAEESASKGVHKVAAQYAERALKILPKGSPNWLRAQDIKKNMADIENR